MKILVVSDTHNKHENLDMVIEELRPDRIFHLGDGEGCEDYVEAVAECPVEIVRGNCDFASNLPAEVVMRVGAHVVMLTHGHYYQVNYGTQVLVEAARDKGADVVFYGHTHVPEITWQGEVLVINPGSISYPRQEGREPSYAVVDVDKNGEFSCEIQFL